jgi:hypothetical protein
MRVTENVFVVHHSTELKLCATSVKIIQALLGQRSDCEIGIDERGTRGDSGVSLGNTVDSSDLNAGPSAKNRRYIRPCVERWRRPEVFQNEVNTGVACRTEIGEVLPGFVGRQVEGLGHQPSSLSNHESVLALLDLRIEDEQAQQRKDSYAYSDPIQVLSSSKRIGAIVFLFGISLIVLGARLQSYGQRVWDFYHAIAYWGGYFACVMGGLIVVLVLFGFAGQWVYPSS